MHPAVMRDLMALAMDALDELRIGQGRMARHAEGARDAMLGEEVQDARDGDGAELAARDHARVAGLVGAHPHRHGVEVEGQCTSERHDGLSCLMRSVRACAHYALPGPSPNTLQKVGTRAGVPAPRTA